MTDGLTPAHHYPLEEKLTEFHGEKGLEARDSRRKKIVLPGETRRHQLRNNWEYWGTKGVMTTHFAFELGVMTTLAAQRYQVSYFHLQQGDVTAKTFRTRYMDVVSRIAVMKMYEEFTQKGWTRHLARETRQVLIPLIVEMVALAWLVAVQLAEEKE